MGIYWVFLIEMIHIFIESDKILNDRFLGVGVPPPTPTLGNMVRVGVDYLAPAPWISVFAGLAILVIVLGFNLLGDGLRDIIDPKLYAR